MTKKKYTKKEMALICWTLGFLGIHRLIMGYKNWFLQLITLGGLGIWMVIDFFRILSGQMTMYDGQELE